MRRVLWILLITLTMVGCSDDKSVSLRIADPSSLRQLPVGSVVGHLAESGAHVWRGLPFAKPPVGELRWRAPEPLPPWQGTFEALTDPTSCMQLPSSFDLSTEGPFGDEDCLQLNVFAPQHSVESVPGGDQRYPVLVWIHGGSNLTGTSAEYDWSVFAARHNVVVVAINYRLGVLGWFSHPALWQVGDDMLDRSGNFGTLDQVRALQWVQNNIAAFGGNPGSVTVGGQSAGGVNSLTLLTSPVAKGLFHKVISQSGGGSSTTVSEAENWIDDAEPGFAASSREIIGKLLQADKRVVDRSAVKAYERDVKHSELAAYLRGKSATNILTMLNSQDDIDWDTIPNLLRDGVVIPNRKTMDSFIQGKYHRVPVLLGSNRDEAKYLMAFDQDYTWRLLGVVPVVRNWDHYLRDSEHLSDALKADNADAVAIALASHRGSSVFAYRFDWDEQPDLFGINIGGLMGATHSVELPFVLGSPLKASYMKLMIGEDTDITRDSLSAAMGSYWAKFIHSGNPEQGLKGKLPLWDTWNSSSSSNSRYLVLDTVRGEGIHMSSEFRDEAAVVERLFKDSRYEEHEERCHLLQKMTMWTFLFEDSWLQRHRC